MNREEMIKEAKMYIKAGISLIPVAKNKIPLIPWKEHQFKKAKIEDVIEWFDNFSEMQLGGVTGKISNIIVVDIEKGGDVSWLPPTATVKTGGDGFHYYYSYVPGMTNKVRIKHLTDIRSDGGYVVLPPSENLKGKYEWLVKARLTPFPKSLFVEGKINSDNYQSVQTEYEGCSEGQRSNEMSKYIGHILAKIHPSEWDTIALPIVKTANNKNSPPLSEYELLNIFRSISEREKRNNSDRWYKKEESVEDNKMWNELDNAILPMNEIASMEEFQKGDRYETKIPMIDSAIGGGLEDGDLVIISGITGHGKTTIAQQFAVNFAEQGLPVLFLSYEVKISHLWEKFKEMNIDETLPIYSVQKNTTGNVGWIENKIKEAKEKYQIKLLVIDHLGFLIPKTKMGNMSKNYSIYITQICRDLKQIALKENIVIIMPVHLRKTEDPGLNDLGNSSGIAQESDLVILIQRNKNSNTSGINVYSDFSKIKLVKNRKTGQAVRGFFKLDNGRFIQNEGYVEEESPLPSWKRRSY